MACTRDDIQDSTGRRSAAMFYGHLRGFPLGISGQDYTSGTGVPKNGTTGFAPGAIYQNVKGSAGTSFYINVGSNGYTFEGSTNATSLWLNIDGALVNRLANALALTALNTVSNGTITAAGIVGGATARGGAQSGSAFTDTTATAALIVTAIGGNATIGQAWLYRYVNNTNAPATITGGTGVTVSGITVIPANSFADFLVKYTAAATLTMTGIGAGAAATFQPVATHFTQASTSQTQTYLAAVVTGANHVTLELTGTVAGGAITGTLDTTANILAAIPNAQVGYTYRLRIRNVASTQTITLTAGDGSTTINGTATIATNVWREFDVTVASATTLTLQNVGAGNV